MRSTSKPSLSSALASHSASIFRRAKTSVLPFSARSSAMQACFLSSGSTM